MMTLLDFLGNIDKFQVEQGVNNNHNQVEQRLSAEGQLGYDQSMPNIKVRE